MTYLSGAGVPVMRLMFWCVQEHPDKKICENETIKKVGKYIVHNFFLIGNDVPITYVWQNWLTSMKVATVA